MIHRLVTEMGPDPRRVPSQGVPDQWTKVHPGLLTSLYRPIRTSSPILYQDVWLKDKRQVKFLKPPSMPQPRSRKISLKECLDQGPTPVTSVTAVDDLPGDGGTWEQSLSTPSIEWEHTVYQLNQDPHADSMADSSRGTVIMEKGKTDIAGDEEVEIRDEGLTTGATIDTEAGDLVWDPQDPLFEFNNENSGTTQTPVAALTPVAVRIKDEMPELEDAEPEGPTQGSLPRSPITSASPVMPIRRFMPDYSDVPLVRFS